MSISNDAKSELMVKAFSYIHILNNRGKETGGKTLSDLLCALITGKGNTNQTSNMSYTKHRS